MNTSKIVPRIIASILAISFAVCVCLLARPKGKSSEYTEMGEVSIDVRSGNPKDKSSKYTEMDWKSWGFGVFKGGNSEIEPDGEDVVVIYSQARLFNQNRPDELSAEIGDSVVGYFKKGNCIDVEVFRGNKQFKFY